MNRIVKGALVAAGLVIGGITVAHGAEPCVHEDGSGQAVCSWNAQTQGNGIGESHMVIEGTVVQGHEAHAWELFDSTNAWSLLPYAHTRVEYAGWSPYPYTVDAHTVTVWDEHGNHYLFTLTY